MPTPGFKLVDAGGAEVPLGTVIHDFRGRQWKLHDWRISTDPLSWLDSNTPQRSRSSGRVKVQSYPHSDKHSTRTEFYPSTFNLTILPKDPQP